MIILMMIFMMMKMMNLIWCWLQASDIEHLAQSSVHPVGSRGKPSGDVSCSPHHDDIDMEVSLEATCPDYYGVCDLFPSTLSSTCCLLITPATDFLPENLCSPLLWYPPWFFISPAAECSPVYCIWSPAFSRWILSQWFEAALHLLWLVSTWVNLSCSVDTGDLPIWLSWSSDHIWP